MSLTNLNRLWQIVNAANTISDLARHKQTYTFPLTSTGTFFLRAENAAVRIVRWGRPIVEITASLQPAFGWRLGTDFDDHGVYVALVRRPVVGPIASGHLNVLVPQDTHLMLDLEDGMVQLDHVYGQLHIEPPGTPPALLTDALPGDILPESVRR